MDQLSNVITGTEEEILDPVIMAQLRQITGFDGNGILAELVTVFVSSSVSRLARISGYLDCGDFKGAERQAHSLAGSAGSLGARRLAALCRLLRVAAAEGDTEQARVTLAEVDREFGRARAALETR